MLFLAVIGCRVVAPPSPAPTLDTDDGLVHDVVVYRPPEVEVLFVVDTSTSMWGPIDTLVAGLPIFLDALTEEGFDYHAGAVNIDYGDELGHLEQVNAQRWATPVSPSPGELLQALVRNVPDWDPREVARAAVHEALAGDMDENDGFLRDGSQIAVIIASDAPDDSETWGHVTVDDFLLWFEALRPPEDSTVHGLVATGEDYGSIIGPTGGVEWSFDNTPFGPPLRAVIDTLHHRRLPLSEVPVLDTLEVRVLQQDDTERVVDTENYIVDIEAQTVEIHGDLPLAGDSVRLTYMPSD